MMSKNEFFGCLSCLVDFNDLIGLRNRSLDCVIRPIHQSVLGLLDHISVLGLENGSNDKGMD